MRFVGIDPGNSGAIAVVENGVLVDVFDMPTTTITVGKKNRTLIIPALLADMLQGIKPNYVMLEQVGVRPGEGAVGAFTFGRGVGVIEGIVAAYGFPSGSVTPAMWKRTLRISSEKNVARLTAMRLFPAHADKFKRVKDDGRAEAALIAYYAHQVVN